MRRKKFDAEEAIKKAEAMANKAGWAQQGAIKAELHESVRARGEKETLAEIEKNGEYWKNKAYEFQKYLDEMGLNDEA